MSPSSAAYEDADIRMGEVTWSKTIPAAQAASQQKHLIELAEGARDGVILDCAFVEVANSELLNMLVRVRTQAKKQNKGFVLFNVPESLNSTINVCNLTSVLPVATDISAARKLAYELARGKGQLTRALKRILKR